MQNFTTNDFIGLPNNNQIQVPLNPDYQSSKKSKTNFLKKIFGLTERGKNRRAKREKNGGSFLQNILDTLTESDTAKKFKESAGNILPEVQTEIKPSNSMFVFLILSLTGLYLIFKPSKKY